MSKSQQLAEVGNQLKDLCRILYGDCSPISRVTELSIRTGIKPAVVRAAILASEG